MADRADAQYASASSVVESTVDSTAPIQPTDSIPTEDDEAVEAENTGNNVGQRRRRRRRSGWTWSHLWRPQRRPQQRPSRWNCDGEVIDDADVFVEYALVLSPIELTFMYI